MRRCSLKNLCSLVSALLIGLGGSMTAIGCHRAGQAADTGTPARLSFERSAVSPAKPSPSAKPAARKPDPGSPTDLQAMFDAIEKLPPPSVAATSETPASASATPVMSLETSTNAAAPIPPTGTAPSQTPTLIATTKVVADPDPAPAPPPSPEPEAAPTALPKSLIAQTSVVDPSAAGSSPTLGPGLVQAQPPAVAPALSIPTIALCQRVESYGRYLPFPTTKFLAGKPALMIVYTEIDGFTQSPLDDPNGHAQFVTELAQSIELYLDSDGSRQMVIPEQSVREVSRGRRRDFYLVQRLELPRSLSVGKYNLKARVTDTATGQQAERTVRIEVVADASAVTERRARDAEGVISPENASPLERRPAGPARSGQKTR